MILILGLTDEERGDIINLPFFDTYPQANP